MLLTINTINNNYSFKTFCYVLAENSDWRLQVLSAV